MTRAVLTLDRVFEAPIEDVWAMWTTTDGIESFWGPDGFAVTVETIDVREGGHVRYAMTATAPDKVAFMQRAGMPTTTMTTLRYTQVSAPRQLSWVISADFVPGVEPYDVATHLELTAVEGGTRLVLRFDAMHDDLWTDRSRQGRVSELDRLATSLAARRATRATVTPFLWFNADLTDVAAFYAGVFGDLHTSNIIPGPGGGALSMEFTIAGQHFMGLNGGPLFPFTEAISLFISVDTQAEVDGFWEALIADGGAPSRCGWLKDRFGVSWQVVPRRLHQLLRHPDPKTAARVMASMMQMGKIVIADLEAAAAAG